jgi:hypothetical protein
MNRFIVCVALDFVQHTQYSVVDCREHQEAPTNDDSASSTAITTTCAACKTNDQQAFKCLKMCLPASFMCTRQRIFGLMDRRTDRRWGDARRTPRILPLATQTTQHNHQRGSYSSSIRLFVFNFCSFDKTMMRQSRPMSDVNQVVVIVEEDFDVSY